MVLVGMTLVANQFFMELEFWVLDYRAKMTFILTIDTKINQIALTKELCEM